MAATSSAASGKDQRQISESVQTRQGGRLVPDNAASKVDQQANGDPLRDKGK
jgi:hypothetical protein